MTKVVADIIVTPARLLYSEPGTTAPADTVAAGGDWPAGWTESGYTIEPFTLSYDFDTKEHFIQEALAPVKRRKTKEGLTGETVLAELDLAQVALAWGVDVTTTAAGAGQPGKDEIDLGDVAVLPEKQWGIEGEYEDEDGNSFPIRIFIWRATATAGSKLEFGKENPAGTSLKIGALADMSKAAGERLLKMQKITAAATS